MCELGVPFSPTGFCPDGPNHVMCRTQGLGSWLLPWLPLCLVTSLALWLAHMIMKVYTYSRLPWEYEWFIKVSQKSWWWSLFLGIAIFCMLLTYYMWIKAVKTGSVYWSSVCALAYFYMVSGWKDASQDWLTVRADHVFFFVCRFPPGEAMYSWSTWYPSTFWFWCWRDDFLTESTWPTAQSTVWAPSFPCRSRLLASR